LRRPPAGKRFRRAGGAFTAHFGLFVLRSRIEDSFGLDPLSHPSPFSSLAAVPFLLLPCLALSCLAIAAEPCVAVPCFCSRTLPLKPCLAVAAVPLQLPPNKHAPPPTTAAPSWRSFQTGNEPKQVLRVHENSRAAPFARLQPWSPPPTAAARKVAPPPGDTRAFAAVRALPPSG
jgi:hypothetical protein